MRMSVKENNERLEFLGDSVLSVIISDYIFRRLPNVDEGWLSKYRATLVCEQSLNEISKKISLSKFILLGKVKKRHVDVRRASIVSDHLRRFWRQFILTAVWKR